MKQRLYALGAASLIAFIISTVSIQSQVTNTLSFGTTTEVLNATGTGAVTGQTYALPAGAANVMTVICTHDGSAVSNNWQVSNDASTWITLHTMTGVPTDTRNLGVTAYRFTRINQGSRTGGTFTRCTLSILRAFQITSQAGNISSSRLGVPSGTAPAPSIYSADTINTGFYPYNAGGGTHAMAVGYNGQARMSWDNLGTQIYSHFRPPTSGDASYDIGVSGTARFKDAYFSGVVNAGTFAATANVLAASTGANGFGGRSRLRSPADGNITLLNAAETDFGLLHFGGTTSSFPALGRLTSNVTVRLADDSNYAGLIASSVFLSAANLYFSTAGTTGLQIRGGANSPEGVVSAPVGSLWLRTNGGAGTTLYVKESGTGNTGWVAK